MILVFLPHALCEYVYAYARIMSRLLHLHLPPPPSLPGCLPYPKITTTPPSHHHHHHHHDHQDPSFFFPTSYFMLNVRYPRYFV